MEHDYTNQCWGHALGPIHERNEWIFWPRAWPFIRKATVVRIPCGIGPIAGRMHKGDTILIKLVSGRIGRLWCRKVEYERDPHDMFDGEFLAIGYKE